VCIIHNTFYRRTLFVFLYMKCICVWETSNQFQSLKLLFVWYFVFVLKWEMLFYGDVFNHRYLHKLLHTFIRNRPMLYTRHTHAYFWPLQHSLAIMPFDRFSSKIKIRHFSCNISSLYILESSDRNGKFFAHYAWVQNIYGYF
jgi:hypothetical protein